MKGLAQMWPLRVLLLGMLAMAVAHELGYWPLSRTTGVFQIVALVIGSYLHGETTVMRKWTKDLEQRADRLARVTTYEGGYDDGYREGERSSHDPR